MPYDCQALHYLDKEEHGKIPTCCNDVSSFEYGRHCTRPCSVICSVPLIKNFQSICSWFGSCNIENIKIFKNWKHKHFHCAYLLLRGIIRIFGCWDNYFFVVTLDTKGVTGEQSGHMMTDCHCSRHNGCIHVVHHHKRYKMCWCEFINCLTTICVVLHFIGSAGGRDLAVSSSPRPWIAVFVLPEKVSTFFNKAVTESDLDPKVRKMATTYYNWLFEVKSQIWPSKEMSHDFLRGQPLGLVRTPWPLPLSFSATLIILW